jgi:dihydroorotate dehydrogenase electron transfer subunit
MDLSKAFERIWENFLQKVFPRKKLERFSDQKMKQSIFTVISNRRIAKNTFEMKLSGDNSDITAPGQFVNIQLDGFYLRRPISVCDVEGDTLTLIYKVVGMGTEKMSEMNGGEKLDLLTGLGNGYDLSRSGEAPLLIGGGVGLPPMYLLAKKLVEEGKRVSVIAGFGSADEVFYKEEFEKLGASFVVTTVDGSLGIKGFVTNALDSVKGYTSIMTCGPEPMLKAIYLSTDCDAQFSFEERMGCGFGACMGCSCKTVTGYKRICKDGPILCREEILWETQQK